MNSLVFEVTSRSDDEDIVKGQFAFTYLNPEACIDSVPNLDDFVTGHMFNGYLNGSKFRLKFLHDRFPEQIKNLPEKNYMKHEINFVQQLKDSAVIEVKNENTKKIKM